MSITKRINFFVPVVAKQADAKYRMKKIVHICIWLCAAMSVLTFLVYALQYRLNADIESLRQQTIETQNQYTQRIANQKKLSIISSRLKTIIAAEKTDIDFRTKQNRLTELMDLIATPKVVTSLTFDTKGIFTATLTFASKSDMKSFVAEVEQADFQRQIKLMTVSDLTFNVIESKDSSEAQMTINGEFL